MLEFIFTLALTVLLYTTAVDTRASASDNNSLSTDKLG